MPRVTDLTETEDPRRGLVSAVLLAGLVLLALALRLYRLDWESIWYDEAFSLNVSHVPWPQMNQALIRDVVHPPLHYYVLHAWLSACGWGVFQGRLLSALFGTLAVLMIAVLAHLLFGRRTAVVSALLLAVSQLAIMLSQEARPYAQFLLLYLACAYLFLRALREHRLRLWIGFLAAACLLIYTHYYGFLALGSMALFGLAYRKRYPLPPAWWGGGIVGLALAYVPWLTSGVVGEALHGQKVQRIKAVTQVYHHEHWFSFVTLLNTFNNGRANGFQSAAPWWTFIVGGLLFSVPAALALGPLIKRHGPEEVVARERENLVYLAFLTALPAGLALAFSLLHANYDVKYVAFCAAPYYVLVARGLSHGPPASLRWTLVACVAAYSGWALRADYFIPYKEDYKHALASVARDAQPADCEVVAPLWEEPPARWAWSIYEDSRPGPRVVSLDSALSATEPCPRVWLVSIAYRGNPQALQDAESARQRLAQTYVGLERRRFFSIDVNLYAQAPGKLPAQPGK
jgi:4-amino-4-deoxy-L-arabinose transferase-like glycosyltransferase